MRFWHNNVEVETIFAQFCVRVPSFGPLETLPHGVFDLNNRYSRFFKIKLGISRSHLYARVWQLFRLLYTFPAVDGSRMPKPVMIIIVIFIILIILIKILITIIKIFIDRMTNRRFPIGGWANGTPYQADTVLGKGD